MITVLFTPKEDITAYELAVIVAHLIGKGGAPVYGVQFSHVNWGKLPENLKRHFTVKP